MATAEARVSAAGVSVVAASAASSATLAGNASARASARHGVAPPDASVAAGQLGFAAAVGNPLAADVDAALAGQATSASRFTSSNAAQLLLLASGASQSPAGQAGSVTRALRWSVSVDLSAIAQIDRRNLQLALLNPRLTGSGPDAVRLRLVREGTTVHDVTLTSPGAARGYFTDRVLDFGSIETGVTGTLDVDILIDVTTSTPDAGFSTSLFLGNAAPAPVLSIDQWRTVYFGSGATNTGNAADEANPSGDGLSNLLKFALGLNPLLAYPPGTGVACDTATGYLRLTAERNPAASGLQMVVEGTDDPGPVGAWSTLGLIIEQNSATLLQVRDNTPIAPGAKRMLRLKATRM